jgi:hypothetical protein
MPLNPKDAALLGAGMLAAGAATFFYRRKQTTPFKVAYFVAWPTLGSAIILTGMPSDDRVKAELRRPPADVAAIGASARAAAAAAAAAGRRLE